MEHCPWTAQPEELLDRLGAAPDGLTAEEAARRLAQYGPNELQEGPKKSGLRIFLEQFKDFLVLILIAAAAAYSSPQPHRSIALARFSARPPPGAPPAWLDSCRGRLLRALSHPSPL